MYTIVEKSDVLAVHGVFDTYAAAKRHLETIIPLYIVRGFFVDKSLTKNSFQIIHSAVESAQVVVEKNYNAAQENASDVVEKGRMEAQRKVR